MVNCMFKEQIGKNMEVYVDDLLVNSRTHAQHLADLCEVFVVLWQYQMKLNPTKCKFGVEFGKFLGFMVSERRIEASPKKVEAILKMAPPRNINEV